MVWSDLWLLFASGGRVSIGVRWVLMILYWILVSFEDGRGPMRCGRDLMISVGIWSIVVINGCGFELFGDWSTERGGPWPVRSTEAMAWIGAGIWQSVFD